MKSTETNLILSWNFVSSRLGEAAWSSKVQLQTLKSYFSTSRNPFEFRLLILALEDSGEYWTGVASTTHPSKFYFSFYLSIFENWSINSHDFSPSMHSEMSTNRKCRSYRFWNFYLLPCGTLSKSLCTPAAKLPVYWKFKKSTRISRK